MEKHVLSKSSFIRGVQCQKSLYLYKHFYKQRDPLSASQQAIFNRGTNIGILAQDLFPGGVDASPKSKFKYHESVALTQELIKNGTSIIYEAAFQFKETLVLLDILVKQNNQWYAYEVKSSTKISPTYILDASLQYYIINNSGIELADIFILNINTDYIRNGKLDPQQLFRTTSVKVEAEKHTLYIEEQLEKSLQTVKSNNQPDINIGQQCTSPYNCDFIGTCWKNIPENSVLNMGGVSKEELFNLYNSGIKTINDIPANLELNKNIQLQVDSLKNNKIIIDKEAIKQFLKTISYPVYFMDFETIMPAAPIFNNSHPYQHIPFQYSLHYKETPSSSLLHFDFLAEAGVDPRRYFVESLLHHTKQPGDILTYNATFERSVLKNLKKDFPEFTDELNYLSYRIKDLITPFENKHYYHPKMKGLYSIKNVLAAISVTINHKTLDVGSGSVAMSTFEQLQNETDIFKIAEARDALKAYCEMDTLAMTIILDELERVVAD